MASIEPNPAQRATLLKAAADNPEPVVMINLLQFGLDGAASYQRYAKEVQPYLDSVGATVLYAGEVSHVVAGDVDRLWWDAIVVVSYPSRAAFLAGPADGSLSPRTSPLMQRRCAISGDFGISSRLHAQCSDRGCSQTGRAESTPTKELLRLLAALRELT